MVERTVRSYDHLDIIFNNVGIFNNHQGILDLDLTTCDHLFAVKVWGMATCVKHVVQSIVVTGVKGSIVCMASMVATSRAENYNDYVMSKHAMLGLVRSASRYLGKHGIKVNCVSPSALTTPTSIN
uniref:Uncharacterized protein n=1 Tax=Nelumbo nucifera TaxID=4432 RepID=A0A822Y4B6_NELNU|nr:TPA_asm: hypothetical protein HUJ06_027353 [Nelumbo nucifera]